MTNPEDTVPLWEYYFRIVLIAIFILFTVVGNLLVINAIINIRKHRHASHGLLLNLFISDTLVGCTVMPIYMANLITNEVMCNLPLCYVTAFVKTFITMFSLYSLALLCIERLFMFKFPVKHRKIFTSVWKLILIAIILSLSVPSIAVTIFGVDHFPKQNLCWFNLDKLSFVLTFFVILFGFPCLALVFSTLVLIKILKDRKPQVGNMASNESDKTESKTSIGYFKSLRNFRFCFLVVLMVLVFLFCHVPNMVTALCELSNHCQISERLSIGSKFLHFSKSILNTVMYGLFNKQIRSNLLKSFRKRPQN